MVLGGYATGVRKEAATWNMLIKQYCMASKDTSLPISARIPDSPRYKDKDNKPVPRDLASVIATGPLTGIDLKKDQSVANVNVDVEHIAFVGLAAKVVPTDSSIAVSSSERE